MVQAVYDIGRRSWLKTLAGGVVLFILLERTLASTGDIIYVPSLLLIGAFTVPLAFCLFIYSRAKVPEVPLTTLGFCVLWGGVVGTVIAGNLEYRTVLDLNALPTLAIGVIEEIAKVILPVYLLLRRPYRHVYDGYVIGVAVGAGFAAMESMGYGLVALLASHGNITATVQTLMFRALMAPAAHIAWTGLLAGALWQARYGTGRSQPSRLITTFVGVVVLHALWDSAAMLWQVIVLGLISVIWLFARLHSAETQTAARPAAAA